MTEPTLITVYREAYSILRQYKLTDKGWTFDFSNEKNTLGRCYYKKRQIVFSSYFLHLEPEQITDTLLHETAHALVGPNHGHDAIWKQIAQGIGASPVRCAPVGTTTSAKPNYLIRCSRYPDCTWKVKRFRLKQALYSALCPHCHSPVVIFKFRR